MAGSSRRSSARSWRPRWLTHRGLVAVEAILLCNLGKDLGEAHLAAWDEVPAWLRVLLYMLLTAGCFGVLVMAVEWLAARSVRSAHAAAARLPLPAPLLVAHLLLLAGLYVGYAWSLKLWS